MQGRRTCSAPRASRASCSRPVGVSNPRVCVSNVWPTLARVCPKLMCVFNTHVRERAWSCVQHSRGCVQLSRGCVLHACVSADVSFASRCATLKERCLPRPKSRVERLKANVEPLLIEVTVETCGGPRASGTSRSRSFPGPPSGHEPPPLATRAFDHQFDRQPGSMSPSCSAADRLFRLHRIV